LWTRWYLISRRYGGSRYDLVDKIAVSTAINNLFVVDAVVVIKVVKNTVEVTTVVLMMTDFDTVVDNKAVVNTAVGGDCFNSGDCECSGRLYNGR